MTRPRLAVVVSGFPRTSETFALNELAALQDRGILAGVYSTKPGDGSHLQPGSVRLLPHVTMLPDGTAEEQGTALAESVSSSRATAIHAYFAHTPAEVAAYAADRLDLPFGFSTHARDSRKTDRAALAQRCAQARCVLACNHDVARDVHRAGGRTHVVPHGVDLQRFPAAAQAPDGPFRLLAVGRLVPKKGFDVLIDAAARLRHPFVLRIVGDGPERQPLEARAADRGIADRVSFAGPATHRELPGEYAASHVVVVPSVVDASGDRDGLPNVILEAMSSGRAVVASRVGAIETAVEDFETGLLVPSGSVTDLADALDVLAARLHWCDALGRRGRHRAERQFDVVECSACFARLLEGAYA